MHTNTLLSRFVSTGTRLVVFVAMIAALLSSVMPASAATVPFDLYAVSGTTTLGVQTVTVWGYNTANAPVTQPGGPTLIVNQGDTVQITLHNQLTESTALLFQGLDNAIPDRIGVAPLGTKTYTFTAGRPGTYLYEAGLLPNAQHQVAMGLYGALIVRPTSAPDVVIPGQAYSDPATAYTDEAVLVLSEIDPALNNRSVTLGGPATFDMRKYAPRYFLINGKTYPNTAAIPTTAGNRVLLRYVNAGNQYHSMAVLGTHQAVIALDGSPLGFSRRYVAETFGPGQTADAIVTVPASTTDGRIAVYDSSLLLHSSNTAGFGGMLTFLAVTGSGGGTDTTGPATSNVAYAAGTLTATVDDSTTGGNTITAAEYYLDSTSGTGTPMSGAFGSVSVNVTALVAIPAGQHTLYVRGQDSLGNWGAFSSVLVNGGDLTGPTTKSPALTPSLTNGTGTAGVAVHATGDDTASGGSNIAAAEYTIDGGTAVPMTVNQSAPIASLDATIPAAAVNALAEGTHVVSIRSQDAANNWGAPITVNLVVDKTGPNTSGVSAAPNPNNGTLPFNASTPAVRVAATTLSDPIAGGLRSNISAAEAFLCTTPALNCAVGANGTGIPLAAVDGVFDNPSEAGYADIPLATVLQLTNGNHTIYVHAKDAAGNWGATSSTLLLIDKIAPTIVSINRVNPDPTSAATVSFLVTFSEPVTGVTSGNFTLASGPGLTGAAITSVTGNGATRTVTASTGSGGGGTLGLNLTSAAGITDTAGNALPTTGLPFVGQVYTQPSPPLYFSTFGNTNPPGVGGTSDDADIYFWNGTSAFSRSIDVTAITNPLPTGANVDGFDRVDATHFYMSFNGAVTIVLPGPDLTVQDEDVVYYNAGTWSLFFDGSVNGVGGTDLDAISIVGGTLYFSTDNTTVPPGAGGTGDDADIYRWNGGSSYTRMVDASAVGWSTANVDGLVWVDATHVYLSYSTDTTVPGIGAVQDEDVVRNNGGVWSVYFNSTARGLTAANLDVDAFDLP
jgi:FtsP/CotA-like multicopper oxidase with cupredoxin domain